MFTDRRANTLKKRRHRQPWPSNRPFKILSLDGGGIRGIYTAELLRHCEAQLGQGKGIASYFDMIAGTSTGGIIALGLGLGIRTPEIAAFYKDDGREIFPPLPTGALGKAGRLARSALSPKLNHDALEAALKRRLEDHTLGESTARLVIPAFLMPKTEIAVFKTDHHIDFRNDHKTEMWKVARATSAAPTYLQGLEHNESGKIFIDGGLWANNPVMVALVDAMSAYELTFDQIQILSIGTGNKPFELQADDALSGWFAWREVINAAMYLTTDNATAQAKLLLGPDSCHRIEPQGEAACIELDDYDTAFGLLPHLSQQDFDTHLEAISQFFLTAVEPRERHHTS